MQNSSVMLAFTVFDQRSNFLTKRPKNQNCYFRLEFDTQSYSNMGNAMVLFTFSILDQKYS